MATGFAYVPATHDGRNVHAPRDPWMDRVNARSIVDEMRNLDFDDSTILTDSLEFLGIDDPVYDEIVRIIDGE